jgi:hypothetical protein
VSTLRDENVGRLDVAVDDPFGVRCIQSVCDLNRQSQRLIQRQRLAGNAVFQRFAVEKLHRNEGLSVVFADFMDGAKYWDGFRAEAACASRGPRRL